LLLDLAASGEAPPLSVDLCIVGAGAAGLTLARELVNRRLQVCLIEGGGLHGDPAAQALLRGEIVGRPYYPLEQVRISGFGGTTTIWNGACRPLDAIDFSQRDWVPWSGWPITRDELDPYYARAQTVCQLGPFTYNVDDWETGQERRLPLSPDSIDTHIFQLSRTRFGNVYRRAVLDASNIYTCLRAHAVEIETDADGRNATGIHLKTLDGRDRRVKARAIVLAAGGIETPRLLLLSRRAVACGLGNQHDLVGRFFTEHLYMDSGELVLCNGWRRSPFYSIHSSTRAGAPSRIEAVLAVSDERQRHEGLLRAGFLFPPRWRTGPAYYSSGVTSLLHMVRLVRMGHRPYQWREHARSVLGQLDKVVATSRRRIFGRSEPPNRAMVRAFAEQSPNYESRVQLSSRRDRLGRNLVRLDWRLKDTDLHSMRRAHEILAEEVQRAQLGRLEVQLDTRDAEWPSRLTGGYHHMGTTRMHADPHQGVVDANCRVHGTSNVYVAGSSVFPTVGYANPTLTIVALSLRLADHLRATLS
jgi:choline dehydrogenase-like flavoprotein